MNNHCTELKKLFISKYKKRFDKMKMIAFTHRTNTKSNNINLVVNVQITKLTKNCGNERDTSKPYSHETQQKFKCKLIARDSEHQYDFDYKQCERCDTVCECCNELTQLFECEEFTKCFDESNRYMLKLTHCKGCCKLLCNIPYDDNNVPTFEDPYLGVREYVEQFEGYMDLNNIIIGTDVYCSNCTKTILFENTNSFVCVVCKEEKLNYGAHVYKQFNESCEKHSNKICKLCYKKTEECPICGKQKFDKNQQDNM